MPYLVCPKCGLETYSAARHSTKDACPHCDTALRRSPGIGARVRELTPGEIIPTGWAPSVRVAP